MFKVMAGYDGLDPRMTPELSMPGQVKGYPALLVEFMKNAKDAATQKPIMKAGLLQEAFDFPSLSPKTDYGLAAKPPDYLSDGPDHIETQSSPTQEMFDYITAGNPTIMNLIFSTDYLREI
ncbi:hypothetical protein BDW68DRAFT_180882 [Aspergillus falconensis]